MKRRRQPHNEPPSNLDRLDEQITRSVLAQFIDLGRHHGSYSLAAEQWCGPVDCGDSECRYCSPAPITHDIPEPPFDYLRRDKGQENMPENMPPPTMAEFEADTRRYIAVALAEMRRRLDSIDRLPRRPIPGEPHLDLLEHNEPWHRRLVWAYRRRRAAIIEAFANRRSTP